MQNFWIDNKLVEALGQWSTFFKWNLERDEVKTVELVFSITRLSTIPSRSLLLKMRCVKISVLKSYCMMLCMILCMT